MGLERFKGWRALVTGASAGIGAELARALAKAGCNLVITARRVERLKALAAELRDAHGVEVAVVAGDLATPAGIDAVVAGCDAAGPVDLLVNNAGLGKAGRFLDNDWAMEQAVLAVNVGACLALTHRLVPAMVERGRGHVVFLGSIAAYTPIPWFAAYAASKAYIKRFAEGLSRELAGTGVGVTTVHPGGTASEFSDVAGMALDERLEKTLMPAAAVVDIGLRGAARGKLNVVTGALNVLTVWLMRLVPTGLMMRVTGGLYQKLAGPK